MYNIELANLAKKFLKKCERDMRNRLMSKLKELANNPFPQDSKRIIGRKERTFRIRVGAYRILYMVFQERSLIFVVDVDKRSRVYQ